MNGFQIITIENDESFVTIDTLVKFSGNAEKAIKTSINKYKTELEGFSEKHFSTLSIKGANNGAMDWSLVRLNEDQATFLLSLMQNTDEVVKFKINLVKEFRRLKNKEIIQLSPMEQMKASLVFASEQVAKEKAAKSRALNMLENAKLIEATNEGTRDDVPVEEFCKMLSDKFSVMIGRTLVYQILREMGLVMQESNKPTQRGLLVYLSFRKHERNYSTRVFVNRADKLSKYMLRFLVANPEVNEALGNPFDI